MTEVKKEKLLQTELGCLPDISNRVGNRLPWTYSSELTVRGFFEMCQESRNLRTIDGINAPRIPGVGRKGLQEIRRALLKVGFTTKDSPFLHMSNLLPEVS